MIIVKVYNQNYNNQAKYNIIKYFRYFNVIQKENFLKVSHFHTDLKMRGKIVKVCHLY